MNEDRDLLSEIVDVRRAVRLLRRRALWIVALVGASFVSGFSASYVLERTYKATALVLIRPSESLNINPTSDSKEILSYPVTGGGGSDVVDTPANTYVEILSSRAVSERLVRTLELHRTDSSGEGSITESLKDALRFTIRFLKYGRAVEPPSPFEEAVERVQESLSLNALADTHLLEIEFESDSAEKAARGANEAAALLLEHMVEMNLAEGKRSIDFIASRLEESERELERAREALRVFKESGSTIAFETEVGEDVRQAARLQSVLEEKEAELASLRETLTPANRKVRALAAEVETLRRFLDRRRKAMKSLPQFEQELGRRALEVQVSEKTYELLRSEYDAARVRQTDHWSEMQIVSPAVTPLYPSKPIPMKYALIAAALATFAGTAWVFVRSGLDPTLQSVRDVERLLDLPVLATLPRSATRSTAQG